jgi:dolichol-phosphate mannosyltransferase
MTKDSQLKIGIVIPTYNESANIESLLNKIIIVKEKNDYNLTVLIVDDNSPDKTGDIVEAFAAKNKGKINLKLMRRSGKLGLASAYKQGFTSLIEECDCLMSMDADLSHDPEHLPAFVNSFKSGNNLVIGSRYINGGGVKGWGVYRLFISRVTSIACNILLRVLVKDFTGGFNLYSSNALKELNLESIKAEGYLFQIEMKYSLIKKGLKYAETPIVFNDRQAGKSKFSRKIMIEAFFGVLKLAFNIK